ncbi:hypothetical protein BDK51DRAFT_34983 [Blyttiomyces helicus]|uniref:Uncharacterized protein n=1 Tax=Blyttiomyces helicus TaxID=388810 RepID=A0A4V1ISS4_9FUNG|nr:hypothetical protein BDK51DRAFT_34983 [Blyttiomyces helicus]|eukprot:RKO94567.1 hypothetical protein BDK51DRAFT_34983 [Blyttiomyces helicus]
MTSQPINPPASCTLSGNQTVHHDWAPPPPRTRRHYVMKQRALTNQLTTLQQAANSRVRFGWMGTEGRIGSGQVGSDRVRSDQGHGETGSGWGSFGTWLYGWDREGLHLGCGARWFWSGWVGLDRIGSAGVETDGTGSDRIAHPVQQNLQSVELFMKLCSQSL